MQAWERDWRRPSVKERPDYEPSAPQEQFIVPLLRRFIEGGIETYAKPVPADACALDVGCGAQPFRSKLEGLGYKYTSMDVQQNDDKSVDVIAAIDAPLPEILRARSFHFVLCTEVLEHVVDWRQAFTNLTALTEPGGRLLITCPHFYQLHEEPYDFWRATPHALRYFAEAFGTKILEDKAAGDAWDVLGTLLTNCSPFSPSYRISDRLVRKLVALSQKYLLKLLLSRRLQRVV